MKMIYAALMLLFFGLIQHVYAQKPSGVFCETSTVDRFGPEGAAHAKQFLARLQAAIRRDDRHQVAAMVEYPLKGESAGHLERVIRSEGEFEASYDMIVTARVKQIILHQGTTCLNGQGFSPNYEVILGAGDVYFYSDDGGVSFKIGVISSAAGHMTDWSIPGQLAKPEACENGGNGEHEADCRPQTVDGFGPVGAAQARSFLERLQVAVWRNDKRQVALMVSYPLRGEARDNVGIVIKSAEEFEASYDKIMTERVRQLVLHQSPAGLIGKVLSDHSELVILSDKNLYFEDKKKDGEFKVVIIESAEHSDGSWSAYIAPGWETYCLKSGDCDNGAPWWAAGSDGSTAGEWAPGMPPNVRAFVENLQGAIRSNDRGRVASLMHYPLRVSYFYGDRDLRIQSRTQFIANYDKIMTESLTTAILNESPRSVFVRDDGAALINGAIWFDVYNNQNKIRSILVH